MALTGLEQPSWSTLPSLSQASSSTHAWTNSTCTFNVSSLNISASASFQGMGRLQRGQAKVNLAQGVRERNGQRTCGSPEQTAAMGLHGHQGLRKTSFLFGSLLPEARSHHQETQDAPWSTRYCSDWLGQWEMIQESLPCISSAFGHRTRYLLWIALGLHFDNSTPWRGCRWGVALWTFFPP